MPETPPRWAVEPYDETQDPVDPGEGDGCVGEGDAEAEADDV